jgi:hypothetical protein
VLIDTKVWTPCEELSNRSRKNERQVRNGVRKGRLTVSGSAQTAARDAPPSFGHGEHLNGTGAVADTTVYGPRVTVPVLIVVMLTSFGARR